MICIFCTTWLLNSAIYFIWHKETLTCSNSKGKLLDLFKDSRLCSGLDGQFKGFFQRYFLPIKNFYLTLWFYCIFKNFICIVQDVSQRDKEYFSVIIAISSSHKESQTFLTLNVLYILYLFLYIFEKFEVSVAIWIKSKPCNWQKYLLNFL